MDVLSGLTLALLGAGVGFGVCWFTKDKILSMLGRK